MNETRGDELDRETLETERELLGHLLDFAERELRARERRRVAWTIVGLLVFWCGAAAFGIWLAGRGE